MIIAHQHLFLSDSFIWQLHGLDLNLTLFFTLVLHSILAIGSHFVHFQGSPHGT